MAQVCPIIVPSPPESRGGGMRPKQHQLVPSREFICKEELSLPSRVPKPAWKKPGAVCGHRDSEESPLCRRGESQHESIAEPKPPEGKNDDDVFWISEPEAYSILCSQLSHSTKPLSSLHLALVGKFYSIYGKVVTFNNLFLDSAINSHLVLIVLNRPTYIYCHCKKHLNL